MSLSAQQHIKRAEELLKAGDAPGLREVETVRFHRLMAHSQAHSSLALAKLALESVTGERKEAA